MQGILEILMIILCKIKTHQIMKAYNIQNSIRQCVTAKHST